MDRVKKVGVPDLTVAPPKRGWELHHGLFEIHWKNGFADRVKICGTEFHYLSGKKAKPARWRP